MITHAQFARQAAHLSSNAAGWAAEVIMLPEQTHEPMRADSIERFVKYVREMADMIERMHREGDT